MLVIIDPPLTLFLIKGRGIDLTPKTDRSFFIRAGNAKFDVLRASGLTTITSVNPFIVKRVTDYCCGEVGSNGALLVKTINVGQVNLLKLTKFHCYDVV